MTNYLELGARTLLSRMSQYAGSEVEYLRKSTGESVNLIAVPARVISATYDANGILLRNVNRDFIVDRKWFLNFQIQYPVRNDEIRQTLNGFVEVFLVNAETTAMSHYEEADSFGVAWRIHTKRDHYA